MLDLWTVNIDGFMEKDISNIKQNNIKSETRQDRNFRKTIFRTQKQEETQTGVVEN